MYSVCINMSYISSSVCGGFKNAAQCIAFLSDKQTIDMS